MVHSCPICKVALTDKVYDGVTFSECSQCAGIWIFEDDLRQLESESIQDLNQMELMNVPIKPVESPTDALACPKCSGAMEQFHFMIDTPIMLHRCNTCEGIWICDGELTQMAAAIEATNKPPTAEEMALARNVPPIAPTSDAAKGTVPGTAAPAESKSEIQFDQEHAVTMARYNMITSLCKMLTIHLPWL